MGYLDKNLMKDEKIASLSKPHWIIFSKPVFWLFLTFLLFLLGPSYNVTSTTIFLNIPIFKLIAIFTLIMAFLTLLSAYITYATSEFVITNKRVLFKAGLIHRSTIEIILQRVESIAVYQSLLGRLFDYGSITVSGIGGSRDSFPNLPAPMKLRNLIQEQVGIAHERVTIKKEVL